MYSWWIEYPLHKLSTCAIAQYQNHDSMKTHSTPIKTKQKYWEIITGPFSNSCCSSWSSTRCISNNDILPGVPLVHEVLPGLDHGIPIVHEDLPGVHLGVPLVHDVLPGLHLEALLAHEVLPGVHHGVPLIMEFYLVYTMV